VAFCFLLCCISVYCIKKMPFLQEFSKDISNKNRDFRYSEGGEAPKLLKIHAMKQQGKRTGEKPSAAGKRTEFFSRVKKCFYICCFVIAWSILIYGYIYIKTAESISSGFF
jgi:hypothetical protein